MENGLDMLIVQGQKSEEIFMGKEMPISIEGIGKKLATIVRNRKDKG